MNVLPDSVKKEKRKNIIGIIKIDLMAEHLYWIAIDCTGVPNKVATECICIFEIKSSGPEVCFNINLIV